LLIADKGLIWLVAGSVIASIFGVMVNKALLKNLLPFEFSRVKPKFYKKIFQGTWTSAWRSGAGITMTYGTIQGSGLLLAQFLEPPVLASFLLAQKIIQLASSVAQVPFYTQLPKLARLYAQNDIKGVMSISRAGMAESNWILLIAILFIGLFSENILYFVHSKTSFVYMPIWWAMGLAIMLERLGAMYLQIYSLTNDIVWHIANGISGLLMLGFTIIFYNTFGVIGVPLGWAAGYGIFYLPYSIVLSLKKFKPKSKIKELIYNILPILIILTVLNISLYKNYE
jgi:O-antigen/teichoic acid export membrane protein